MVFRHMGRKKMGLRKRKMVTLLSLWNSFLFMWWLVAEKNVGNVRFFRLYYKMFIYFIFVFGFGFGLGEKFWSRCFETRTRQTIMLDLKFSFYGIFIWDSVMFDWASNFENLKECDSLDLKILGTFFFPNVIISLKESRMVMVTCSGGVRIFFFFWGC